MIVRRRLSLSNPARSASSSLSNLASTLSNLTLTSSLVMVADRLYCFPAYDSSAFRRLIAACRGAAISPCQTGASRKRIITRDTVVPA